MNDLRWRVWAAVIAACAWTGMTIQFFSVWGRVGSATLALWRMSIFFTIISNLTVGIVFGLIALGMVRLRHPLLIGGLALTMALVGAVFELMLRGVLHLTGWRIVSNSLLHDAVPLLTCAVWVMLAEKGRLRARDPWIIAIFPILYLVYALVRGAIGGIYPYPFLDGPKIGWEKVSLTVLAISVAFLVCGHLMVMLDRRLARA
ncbi:Pr6Pr family membrane protein [Sphingomonas nostoxanthinifaciens]|uniref:Pr6Pr family membrane protein n=1 Tax=Sphingomonas nostoxanthinifaciens TaxID=2872652 RepID=UPI001CC1EE66|nr:Pr6Pr family membrane protein [Sphingomonas nostoxanthinifaciens]UAK23471.1 Pr6Pr family membrane protein [Sphingomonas nostoxanthinifaciens]